MTRSRGIITWGIADPRSTELYREQTAASIPISLRRKRCACSKVITAKQLRQYGMCDPCARAAAIAREAA